MILRGTAHRYGDDVDTDVIIPATLLAARDPAYLAKYCMTPLDPDFPARVRPGDILVAGRNFGCGSSREHAVLALRGAGIAAVVAESIARIFFRNAINQGLPALVCPEAVAAIRPGDAVGVDVEAGTVTVGNRTFQAQPLPSALREILAAGGLVNHVRARLGAAEGTG